MRAMTKILPVALAAGILCAGPAMADRPPTAEERTKIEDVLKQNGFTRWEEIEFDDGLWEVDDAIGADNVEYDLKLDPNTFEIVQKKPD